MELWRGYFGIALLVIFSVAILGYLASIYFRSRVAAFKEKLGKLSSNVLTKLEVERQEKERQSRLSRIRPQLEIINRRLHGGHMSTAGEERLDFAESVNNSTNSHETNPIRVSTTGQVVVDAAELFDFIDANGDGVLSYHELNTILQLDPLELNDFVRRMNNLSDTSETNQQSVTKAIFVQYFLEVLEETSNFRLTVEETGAQWDEMFATSGVTSKGEVPFKALYSSSLGHFLTDVQIREVILELRKANQIVAAINNVPVSSRSNTFLGSEVSGGVTRDVFLEYYPGILQDILADQARRTERKRTDGIDITFENLKLVVKAGRNGSVNVVDDVSGRIQKGTMTALLGGSGAGKTSLLNALCGKAYYGEVQGEVFINGKKAAVESFSDSIGFVPQDDIVFAELTVRENLIFSGRFRLPRGTSLHTVEDLADSVLVNLGLSRKADSIVGDVTRRGVSGGEKKRVNIGLELMAKPSALFLDEPTSGLDASSALLVMMSLRQLVEREGVTICSVIHQPRKFIFDLFDSVLLLGVGGRMVYHGPVNESLTYFESLGYELPPGESIADWLIDISTGRVAVDRLVHSDDTVENTKEPDEKSIKPLRRKHSTGLTASLTSVPTRLGRTSDAIGRLAHSDDTVGNDKVSDEKNVTPLQRKHSTGLSAPLSSVPSRLEGSSDASDFCNGNEVMGGCMPFSEPTRKDSQVVTAAGLSSNKADRAEKEAKFRRERLFENWKTHFKCLDLEGKKRYEAPEPFAFPVKTVMPTFGTQFLLQMKRTFLLAWRNRVTKTVETAVIVFAVVVMTFLAGTTTLTVEGQAKIPSDMIPNGIDLEDINPVLVPFEAFIASEAAVIEHFFPTLFDFSRSARQGLMQYGLGVGLVASVLIALTSVKAITEKRLEFFREAGSGYNSNAYLLAINVSTTIEQGCQILLAAIIAQWTRHSISSVTAFYVAFLLLTWISMSWSLLIALLLPPKNTMVMLSFFMAFFGLLFGGALPPGDYEGKFHLLLPLKLTSA